MARTLPPVGEVFVGGEKKKGERDVLIGARSHPPRPARSPLDVVSP